MALLLEPEAFAEEDHRQWLIVQVTSEERFRHQHLPEAQLVLPQELILGEPPAVGKLPPLQRLEALLQRLGFDGERRVLALDDEGGGWAGRFLWTLDCLGQRDWAYLNGGLHAWAAAGLPLASGAPEPAPRSRHQTTRQVKLDSAPLALKEDVEQAIATGMQLWDARSPEEYAGLRSGSARAGHLPGARNLDWLALMDPERAWRLPTDVAERIQAVGIDLNRPFITHCQTHHRSSLAYLVARLLGASEPRAYAGSWAEWGNDPDAPIVTGPEPHGTAAP